MKSKILLPVVLLLAVLTGPSLLAQDEYYRPDSLRKEQPERKEVPPVERNPQQKPVLAEKKKLSDFKNKSFIDRLRLGGSFGLSLGTYTNVNLSPMAGYELAENLVAGVGVTGMYFKSNLAGVNSIYYGGRAFLMYAVIPEINIIGEVEALNVEADTYKKYDARKWITSPMLGAAYSQPLGGKFIKAVHLTALYNFNYDNQVDDYGNNISPYGLFWGQPIVIRVTFL
ncbi:hypothetical protein GCM10010967_01930 [Dyadobacter beijingensis]|uniref:Outer membrane protein beta-barrel domain-containing protein n=1 Tax=Dyadobacter beijingensis TaxID=365489 RepID=A0ABQ2HB35_9BACT|nr:hypothetical protein [Dyadobacter beijingensis]GGM73970.1 hypothetical protein GCM10010967_01930 [Dyadobacter beijingensis]